ncbi:MAG TPA: fused MFS/spermidine synthase [Drouetiella sp.]
MSESGKLTKSRFHLTAVYVAFAVSGATALVYELCWQRLLLRVLGSTLPAVTLVLCVFMTGLAVGSFACGKLLRRSGNALRVYGILELAIGILAFWSIHIFNTAPDSLIAAYDGLVAKLLPFAASDQLESFNALFWSRALYASMFLILPTTLMGSTFPCISQYLARFARPHETQSLSYSMNLVGAAVGTILSGFCLLPYLGLTASVYAASLTSVMVGTALLLMFYKSTAEENITTDATSLEQVNPAAKQLPISFFTLCTVVCLNSAVGMSLEVIWSRLFSLLVGNSTYSVASVFAVSIVGLATGAWIFRRNFWTSNGTQIVLALLFLGISIALLVDLHFVLQQLPWFVNSLHQIFSGTNSYQAYLLERILVISLVVLIPSVLCGGIFPIALSSALRANRKESLSQLYAISSLGSILGAALTGFLFIPLLGRIFPSGMESTICFLIAVNCLAALCLLLGSSKKPFAAIPLFLFCTLFVARPSWNQSLMSSGIPFLSLPTRAAKTKEIFDRVLSDGANNKLLFYREGLNTTVTVNVNRAQNIVYLKNDGKVEAALPFDMNKPANTSDLSTQTLLGKLPVSVGSDTDKTVFVIGLGSGATCGGALQSDRVKKLVVAEVEPTVFEINHFFEQSNGNPLRPKWQESRRVEPFCGDARIALNFSMSKYDAIISQPAEPWVSGSAGLYTREFWNLAKSKLAENGIFCQWVQLYSIDPEYLAVLLRTFQNVFPNTYVFHSPRAGELILLGGNSPISGVERHLIAPLSLTPESLRSKLDQLARSYRNEKFNTDDNLLTEYALPERLYLSEQLIDENLKALGIPP